MDIINDNRDASTVSVLIGNGDGTFKPAIYYNTKTEPVGITAGDFNGDGAPDNITITDWGTDTISILLGDTI